MILGSMSLLLAAAIWLPCLHLVFRCHLNDYFSPTGIPPQARAIAARHMKLWSDPVLYAHEIGKMRASNAEWDFMGRTFLVLSLANMSLRDPQIKPACLAVMDRIIDETIRLEREKGIFHFMMSYGRESSFVIQPPRSIFLDGEIALMLAGRRMVREKPEYQPLLQQRIDTIITYMNKSPVLCGESYPNECWTFCNSAALAAIKMYDVLDHRDHSAFIQKWIATAKKKLTDKYTGILVSSFDFYGTPNDGPEGSTIWMVAHCLALVDENYARDQYRRARRELAESFLGFGYAREWPRSWKGPLDVDSGPVIPILNASPSSSGLAFLGAATFGETSFLSQLLPTLNLAGFPIRRGGTLQYAASNQVGEAVFLYAMVQGPLWTKVKSHTQEIKP